MRLAELAVERRNMPRELGKPSSMNQRNLHTSEDLRDGNPSHLDQRAGHKTLCAKPEGLTERCRGLAMRLERTHDV